MTPLLHACDVLLREALRGTSVPPWHLWLEALQASTGADACALLQIRGQELVPLAIHGLDPDTLGRRFVLAEHPRLQAIVSAPDVLRFPADSPLPDPFDGLIPAHSGDLHVHDCVGTVLPGTERPLGVVAIDALRRGTFDSQAIESLRTMASLAGICLEIIERQARLQDAVERQAQVSHALLEELRPEQQLIGRSPAMRTLQKEIATVAPSDLTVLIMGETGCGKELVARAIHYASHRRDKPLISVNCAALPEALAESELFGHVAGAFSGASQHRRGKFEIADGGTLFLDEIGELPLSIQPKLLRVLQSGEIQRVGADEHIRVGVRIVAATNRDLAAEVRAGRFRPDLFHRLSNYPLHVPPLRTRGRDILMLAGSALERNRASLHLRALRLAPEAQREMLVAPWPGNVRELEHTVSRAALRAAAEGTGNDRIVTIHPRHLGLPASGVERAPARLDTETAMVRDASLSSATDEFQRQFIREALAAEKGNWAAAARRMSMDRGNLRRLARRLGMTG